MNIIGIIIISIIVATGSTIFLGYISGELDYYKRLRESESKQETLKICQDWTKILGVCGICLVNVKKLF